MRISDAMVEDTRVHVVGQFQVGFSQLLTARTSALSCPCSFPRPQSILARSPGFICRRDGLDLNPDVHSVILPRHKWLPFHRAGLTSISSLTFARIEHTYTLNISTTVFCLTFPSIPAVLTTCGFSTLPRCSRAQFSPVNRQPISNRASTVPRSPCATTHHHDSQPDQNGCRVSRRPSLHMLCRRSPKHTRLPSPVGDYPSVNDSPQASDKYYVPLVIRF